MTIVYHGKVEKLKEEIARVKSDLDRRYEQVLGKKRVARLDEIARNTLIEESFFDDYKTLNSQLKSNVEETASNKFMVLHFGDFKQGKIKTSPAFYISEKATEYSGHRHILHSYIHEFNHFAWYALQKVPLYLASKIVDEMFNTNEGMGTKGSAYDWIYEVSKRFTEGNEPASRKELLNRTSSIMYAAVLTEHYEKSNGILDKLILEGIGVKVDLDWRHKQRTYNVIGSKESYFAMAMPEGGDPYANLDDKEVIERVLNWQDYRTFQSQTEDIRKFFDMLRGAKVSRMSIKQIQGLTRRKG